MIADRSQTALIATIRFLDDLNAPIPNIAYNDGTLSIGYKLQGSTSWTNLFLVPGTLGTWVANGFVEDSGGNGLYELGIPDAAKIAGKRTNWRFKQGGNRFRYDSIDYVAIPSANTDSIAFDITVPGLGPIFASDNATIYIKEEGVQVTFTANQDISSETLTIVFEEADGTDSYVILDSDITKSGNDATITLPVGFTSTTKNLNWSIRKFSNKKVYGTGRIAVTYAPHED
jgi:hypothetical protein